MAQRTRSTARLAVIAVVALVIGGGIAVSALHGRTSATPAVPPATPVAATPVPAPRPEPSRPEPKEAPKPGKFKVAGGGAQATGDDKVTADAPTEKEGA